MDRDGVLDAAVPGKGPMVTLEGMKLAFDSSTNTFAV